LPEINYNYMSKFVLSLGGSLIYPEKIDVEFLKAFRALILRYVDENEFYIVTGGGRLAREAQAAVKSAGEISGENLDWLGIAATRVNAELVKALFGEEANAEILYDPSIAPVEKKRIYVGGGSRPGWSSDYVAVSLAKTVGAKTLLNLSNIDYVYDKDPRLNADAKPIEKMSWDDMRAIVGGEWKPGANVPFDPLACGLAERSGITVIVLNGKKLDNLEKYLNGDKHVGTIIG